ncbi:MAG TPA: hypothetical protein DCR93_33400, partial [Cytophagales bacterium]|nr:hypothetical protein [Cytophagales bacterium]
RANDLRSSALSLQSEPRGKTSKAQAAQAQKWAEVFDRALLERLDLMHAVVEHQDRVIELLTHEIKNP